MEIESIQPYGTHTLIVHFSNFEEVQETVIRIHAFASVLKNDKQFDLEQVLISHFNLNLIFNTPTPVTEIKAPLKTAWDSFQLKKTSFSKKVWELPVCFDFAYAPDLMTYFKKDQNRIADFLTSLVQQELFVHFFGFQPGFAYLGGLPKELQLPRQQQPRLQVPKGAFALGGAYAAVYPRQSPGGWQLIGQTPFIFFDTQRKPPLFLTPGDSIKIKPISTKKFLVLEKAYAKEPFLPNIIQNQ